MNYKDSIEQTKQGFEESFQVGTYYNKQTRDDMHLELILGCIQVEPGMRILDLGTGSGYLAFSFADKYKQVEVVGLDIVEKTLEKNRRETELEGIKNLRFMCYDGMDFPFEDNAFDIVITRYALHHFPAINDTFREISRVLKKNGALFLSDPTPNDNDVERFVDEYMQMKKDGHIKFYTKDEWRQIGSLVALTYIDGFETVIRFPRKKETALEFDEIVSRHNETAIRGYEVEIIEDEIWISEKVNNLMFRNDKQQ